MAPTPALFNYNHIQTHSDESEDDDGTPYSTPTFLPLSAARRNIPSRTTFSSTTPSTPLHFKGLIPFSWEKLPGISKYQEANKDSKSTRRRLPLPPAGNTISTAATTKLMPHHQEEKSPKMDPFLLALVECSKDDDHLDHGTSLDNLWKGSFKNIITRTLSDRFGFISMHGSCKRSCAVSESTVYLPRSTTSHYLFNRRSS